MIMIILLKQRSSLQLSNDTFLSGQKNAEKNSRRVRRNDVQKIEGGKNYKGLKSSINYFKYL